jgi:hypothetical protein
MATRAEELLPSAVPLRRLLAAPRGFCGGVARAIDVLEAASAASTPDLLIDELIAWLAAMQTLVIEERGPLREDTTYKMPSLDPLA